MPRTSFKQALVLGFGVVWILLIGGGAWHLWNYEAAPGRSSSSGSTLDLKAASSLTNERSSFSKMLLFLHPECSCSRASLEELNRILAKTQTAKKNLVLVFVVPPSLADTYESSALWKRANEIKEAKVVSDLEGRVAKKIGVFTSGHLLLLSSKNDLIFSGGITGSRGHEGPNRGAEAVIGYLRSAKTDLDRTPVFGCSFFEAHSDESASHPHPHSHPHSHSEGRGI